MVGEDGYGVRMGWVCDVPQPYCAIEAAGGQDAPIGAERYRADAIGVTRQGGQ